VAVGSAAVATKARFAYGWDGERLKRLDNSGTVDYLYFYERNVGNGSTVIAESVSRIYHANLGRMRRLVAVRKGAAGQAGTLTYVGTDHLGSTVRVADTQFVAIDLQRYLPFGDKRNPPLEGANIPTDRRLVQIEDASIGLQ
jgi:hypothetical protein